MPNEEKREFTFISEQIKKKPFYRKKWFMNSAAGIGLAVLFGGTAGITFALVKPWAERQFGEPGTPQQIVIEQEESESETEAVRQTAQAETEQTESKEPETVIEEKELEISDYEELYQKLYQVGNSVMDSVVMVTMESGDMDWTTEAVGSQVRMSGLIFAENNQNYYILTGTSGLSSTGQITVEFCDDSQVAGSIQSQDTVTGCAVVTVPVSDVSTSTKEAISTATLGSSVAKEQGTPVISIGSTQDNGHSMAFGMISSVAKTAVTDSQYTVMTTDIAGNGSESGILADLEGNIIGVISQSVGQTADSATITAIGISDMKYMMEAMSNGESIPYLGITGYEISETISKQYAVPQGLYIKEVAADSPAMYAGIQVGIDILTEIDGQEIKTMEDYVNQLRSCEPGQTVKLKLKRRGLDGYVELEVEVTLANK